MIDLLSWSIPSMTASGISYVTEFIPRTLLWSYTEMLPVLEKCVRGYIF